MKVKDLVNKAIYRGTNQKLQTVLLGRVAIVQAINFALNDIYTYEGKEWTFMYHKTLIKPDIKINDKVIWPSETNDRTIIWPLELPIKKVLVVRHMKDIDRDGIGDVVSFHQPHTPPFPGPEWKIQCTEPTLGIEDLKPQHLYFKPGTKEIYLPNNKDNGYVLHWISFFNPVDWEDDIPLPDHFLGLLYNLTLTYLYPINGQYGETKEASNYQIAQTQLVNLAKTDSFQMNEIYGNIH